MLVNMKSICIIFKNLKKYLIVYSKYIGSDLFITHVDVTCMTVIAQRTEKGEWKLTVVKLYMVCNVVEDYLRTACDKQFMYIKNESDHQNCKTKKNHQRLKVKIEQDTKICSINPKQASKEEQGKEQMGQI